MAAIHRIHMSPKYLRIGCTMWIVAILDLWRHFRPSGCGGNHTLYSGFNVLGNSRERREWELVTFSIDRWKQNDAQVVNLKQTMWVCFGTCTWWRHDMEMFTRILFLCEWNPPGTVPGVPPSQRASDGSFFVFFAVSLRKLLNIHNGVASDVRRYGAYVTSL